MKLSFFAADETVFSDITQWLGQQPGFVAPAACQMQRAEQPGIAVMCDYVWLTIAPVKVEATP